jgi:broad specificity phosphatase PhoE
MRTPTATLYVVRHGENPANINREFSYKLVDYSLNEKGVRQAEETAVYFRDAGIDEIYSSPLKRAVETAEIIAAPLGLPVTVVEEFRENNVGDLESQPPSDENWALHDRIIADWYAGRHDSAFPGGEDFLTLIRRVRVGLTTVLGNGNGARGERRIVVVAHGGILNGMARGIATGPELGPFGTSRCPNCSISEFVARLVEGDVKLHLREWAACGHLS